MMETQATSLLAWPVVERDVTPRFRPAGWRSGSFGIAYLVFWHFLVRMLVGESEFVLTAVLVPCFAICPEVMRHAAGSIHLES